MTPRRPRSAGQVVRQRSAAPDLMLPFATGVTAAGLADRPWDCDCAWVPGWVLLRGGWHPCGWRLKFAHRWCAHARMLPG